MRVLHLVHQYIPEHIGGTELYTRWLVRALQERGHDVAIFHRQFNATKDLTFREEDGIRVWSAWTGNLSPKQRFVASFHDPKMIQLFEEVLATYKPELVHVEHLMGLPIAVLNILRRRKIPYVITLWDFWWICANAQLLTNYSQEICDGPRGYMNCACCALARIERTELWPAIPALAGIFAWRGYLLRMVMRHAAALIAPTPFVYHWYADHNAPSDSLCLLEPGLEPVQERSSNKREPARPLRFAYIGGLSWQKGVHVLLDAFSDVKGAWELWIAGDETVAPEYVAELHNRAASQTVRFLGKLDRNQVWETLSQVDVVLVSSLWYETFSFIISEAFAMGVPVVASDLGPLADRVHDGVDGFLVSPGDSGAWRETLQRLVSDLELVQRLKEGVRPPLMITTHAVQIEDLYARFIDNTAKH